MLSREKQTPMSISSSTATLTGDSKNSSKLILLNFKNDNDKRNNENRTDYENKCLSKSQKCSHSPRELCAHHNRDKEINSKRPKTGYGVKSISHANNDRPKDLDKLPTVLPSNKEKSKSKSAHRGTFTSDYHQRISTRDMEILYSMPSLCHPDFNAGQRQMLMSLARIYTNVTPNNRMPGAIIRDDLMLRTRSRNSTIMDNKSSKSNVKSKNRQKTKKLQEDSIQTAVKTFGQEKKVVKKISNGRRCSDEGEIAMYETVLLDFISDIDNDILDEWVNNIIRSQARYLSQESSNTAHTDSEGLNDSRSMDGTVPNSQKEVS